MKTCKTCAHDKRDCDPIRCIEGGLLTMWEERTFPDALQAIMYMENDLGYRCNCAIVRREDGRYALKMEAGS